MCWEGKEEEDCYCCAMLGGELLQTLPARRRGMEVYQSFLAGCSSSRAFSDILLLDGTPGQSI